MLQHKSKFPGGTWPRELRPGVNLVARPKARFWRGANDFPGDVDSGNRLIEFFRSSPGQFSRREGDGMNTKEMLAGRGSREVNKGKTQGLSLEVMDKSLIDLGSVILDMIRMQTNDRLGQVELGSYRGEIRR